MRLLHLTNLVLPLMVATADAGAHEPYDSIDQPQGTVAVFGSMKTSWQAPWLADFDPTETGHRQRQVAQVPTEEMRKLEERDRRLEAERLRKAREAEAALRRNMVRHLSTVPAPFGFNWTETVFAGVAVVSKERSQNLEVIVVTTGRQPQGTGRLILVLCDGHGLQKVHWDSVGYDSWSVLEQARPVRRYRSLQ